MQSSPQNMVDVYAGIHTTKYKQQNAMWDRTDRKSLEFSSSTKPSTYAWQVHYERRRNRLVRVVGVITLSCILCIFAYNSEMENFIPQFSLSSFLLQDNTKNKQKSKLFKNHICHPILEHLEHEEHQKTSILTSDNPIQVQDTPSVCNGDLGITDPLMQIFLSSYLAHQARALGIPIDYNHGCNLGKTSKTEGLVQEYLPSPIMIPSNIHTLSASEVIGICQNVVENGKHYNIRASPHVVYPLILEDVPLRNAILPIVHLNMKTLAANPDGIYSSLPRGSTNDLFDEPKDTEPLVLNDAAAIYLPCLDEECSDIWVFPFHVYIEAMPASVRSIEVILDRHCIDNLRQCHFYGQELVHHLQMFFPRATVNLIIRNPSTMDVIARLTQVEYAICGPGWGEVCLFPTLVRFTHRGDENSRFPVGRVVMLDSALQLIQGKERQSILSPEMFLPHIRPHLVIPDEPMPGNSLVQYGDQTSQILQFVKSLDDKKSGVCRLLRGRVGSWVQDMETYAQTAQYGTTLWHQLGKAERFFREKVDEGETGGLQFRPSSTYKWTESVYPSCNMSLVSREGMCNVLEALNIRRLFILGDSLNESLGLSLWMMLLTGEDNPRKSRGFRYAIPCESGFEFVLQYTRNDQLLENDEPVDMDNQMKNCKNYCYPWTAKYMRDPGRTILFANTGAHLKEPNDFRMAVDHFIDTVDNMNRPDDIVLFRSLVPGHKKCNRKGLTPFANFQEYLLDAEKETTKHTYNWSMFTSYNDYVARTLERRKMNEGKNGRQARMEYLDVFPMTVLRVDGHAADEFIAPGTKITDCLHYSMPGPVDWWSHLAFNHILDIAAS